MATTIKPFFEIYTFDQVKDNRDFNGNTPHAHDLIEIIWTVSGDATLKVDMQTYSPQPDQIFCIMPNQTHHFTTDAATQGYIIRFNELFLQEYNSVYHADLLLVLIQSANIRYSEALRQEMQSIMDKLIQEFSHQQLYSPDILSRYLNILFIHMSRQSQSQQPVHQQHHNTRQAKRFIQLVDQHFRSHKKVSEFADLMCVTPSYLNEAIKKATGYTAGHHIRQRVILEAKRCAAYSDSSMKEVAWDLGFTDICYFSKLFKKETGYNFSEFKKRQEKFWLFSR
jgi:AraC family transcriptional regulator, transcriptional activator of pobA